MGNREHTFIMRVCVLKINKHNKLNKETKNLAKEREKREKDCSKRERNVTRREREMNE